MEDYFQIIFIAIFIISSIISSMNKKKKKAEARKNAQTGSTQMTQPVATRKKQKTSADILEEILGMKVEIPEPQKTEVPYSYGEDEEVEHSWDPTKDYEVKTEQKANDGVSDFQAINDAKKDQASHDRNRYKAFNDEVVIEKFVQNNNYKEKIFASQSNLKDYIIIQELLNKPKALRR